MRSLVGSIALLIASAAGAAEPAGPQLGRPMTPQEVAAASLTVMSNGAGLPSGGGDAVRGAGVYAAHCLACHGEGGRGGPNDALAGGEGSLTGARPIKTIGSYWPYATTVFDYVRRAMPYQAPGSLDTDDVYAVTAYLLFLNGIIGEQAEMNAKSLPAVVMPNHDGFRRAQ